MITKVCSGGQTGADQGGLRAAFELGIPTGGWAPRGFQTSLGPEPRLGTMYGLVEHKSGYAARTFANVRDSCGTIRLAVDFNSAGEKCTLRAIQQYKKPYFDVDLNKPTTIYLARYWIEENNIRILNVAGNSERYPGYNIFQLVYTYIWGVLNGM